MKKRTFYQLLKYSNDIKAIQKGRIGRRVGRRIYGKVSGKLARRLFG
jgi:hypothetical protein